MCQSSQLISGFVCLSEDMPDLELSICSYFLLNRLDHNLQLLGVASFVLNEHDGFQTVRFDQEFPLGKKDSFIASSDLSSKCSSFIK
uniref:Uncharacterized protein n=1 Tax=Manihot esculenta TaxID=3983 RepID=A0A2C9VMU7_MANES